MTAPAVRAGRRAVTIRHEVTGVLEAVTALRVGGLGASTGADLVAARDGLGRIMIPGTSLAGALRAWLGATTTPQASSLFDRVALGKVFGDLPPRTQAGELCRIRVDDAAAIGDVQVGVRDGVGIDRRAGSAAARSLYQHEVVPPGCQFAVRITADQMAGDPERVGEALDLIVGALMSGRVEVGAARTRGLGVVRMTEVTRLSVDLTDRSEVLAWLCGRLDPAPVPAPAPQPDGRLGIEIRWSPVTPVMVQASTASDPEPASEHDPNIVPLRTTVGAAGGPPRLLLPGSSIKGVLRSHAERITRTLLGITDLPDQWLDQVNDERLGPVSALFGVAGDRPRAGADGDGQARPAGKPGRRGALSVRDCHGDMITGRTVTHVAIDRWTGGAAENLLFSVQEPACAEWEPMRLHLDVRRVTSAPADPARADGDQSSAGDGPALALLLLVLRDLANGWLALGFGGTRGRGAVSVSEVTFTGDGLPQPWASLSGRSLASLATEPPADVTQAFDSWREAMGR